MDKGTGIGFEALFNNASMGILVADEQGRIQMANPFLLKQFQYTEAELTNAPVSRLIPSRFHEKHQHHIQQYTAHPRSRPIGVGRDLFAIKKDGSEFPVEISLGYYETPQGKYIIAFLIDISQRKAAESALKQLNTELENKVEERTRSLSSTVTQLVKMIEETRAKDAELRSALEKEKELNELKSRFVSMASHEFRTPLSTVLSSAYLISKYRDATDHDKREKHVQRIVSSVNTLTDVLNDFLSVGRIEEGKIQVRYTYFNIDQHIQSTLQEMNGLLRKGQEIHYAFEGNPDLVLDSGLLKHIIMNLLSNAIKFSPEDARIILNGKRSDDRLLLNISDQGAGISEEDQQHLFERFFRGANVAHIQGTGLGLHIVDKYAELMNGTITCRSRLNEGTTFELNFHLQNQE